MIGGCTYFPSQSYAGSLLASKTMRNPSHKVFSEIAFGMPAVQRVLATQTSGRGGVAESW